MNSPDRQLALMLLDIGAITLQPTQPFTWSSGWKAPIYVDNRLALAYHNIRSFVTQQLVNLVEQHFTSANAIAAVATGAIAQGALVAEALRLPFCYVRPRAKDHGTAQQIEGQLPSWSNVVVVEDLVSTGQSSLKAVEALRAEGLHVVGMVASFTYGFDVAQQAFDKAQVPLATISNYAITIDVAEEKQLINAATRNMLNRWREAPQSWQAEEL